MTNSRKPHGHGESNRTMKNQVRKSDAGFIQIIITIIVVLFILKFLGLTLSDVINWFKTTFESVLR